MNKWIAVIVCSLAFAGCGGGAGTEGSAPSPHDTSSPDTGTPTTPIEPPAVVNPTDPTTGSCAVNGLPYAGTASASGTTLQLASKFTLDGAKTFVLNVPEDHYGWFAYPAALGEATFSFPGSGAQTGGWDGATWPLDEIGASTKPVVVDVNGTRWFVYRTDFPGIGDMYVQVDFANPTLGVGDSIDCDTSGYISGFELGYTWVESEPPAPIVSPTTGTCVVNAYPRAGKSIANLTSASQVMNGHTMYQVFTDTENQSFQLTLMEGEYGFFAMPAALGRATFWDNGNGFRGAWDGATWPVGEIVEHSLMPVVYNIDGHDWLVYRTDFPGLGTINFTVVFEHAGLELNESGSCDLASYPKLADMSDSWSATETLPDDGLETPPSPTGLCGVNGVPTYGVSAVPTAVVTANIGTVLTEAFPDTQNGSFEIDVVGLNDYGWFAHPAALGEATFTDNVLGWNGAWDGAAWPQGPGEMGDTFGPAVFYKDGEAWFLYRTDFSNLGDLSYSVTFPNAGLSQGSTVSCDLSDYLMAQVFTYGTVSGDSTITRMFVTEQDEPVELVSTSVDAAGSWAIDVSQLAEGEYTLYFAGSVTWGPSAITVQKGRITQTSFDVSGWSAN